MQLIEYMKFNYFNICIIYSSIILFYKQVKIEKLLWFSCFFCFKTKTEKPKNIHFTVLEIQIERKKRFKG